MKPAEAALLVGIAAVLGIAMVPQVREVMIGGVSAYVWLMVVLMVGAPLLGLLLSRGDRS